MSKKTLYLSLILVLLFFSCNKKSNLNQANNDSIAKYLKLASTDSLPFSLRDKYNEKAFSLIDLSRNDSVLRWNLFKTSHNFYLTKNWKSYFKISKIHFNKALDKKDTLNIARYYRFKAGYFRRHLLNDSSYYYFIKAEKFYKRSNDKIGLARTYLNKSILLFDIDDYLGSNYAAKQSYLIANKEKNTILKYEVINQLGNCEHNLKEFKNAINYHQIALSIANNYKNFNSKKSNYIGTSLNNIGNTYKELKNFKRAIYYFEKAIKNEKLKKYDIELMGFLFANKGYCQMQLKQYNNLPNLFTRSAKIFDSLGIKSECSLSNVYLSDYYFRKKDTSKAISFSQKALQIAKESKAPFYYLIALSNAGYVNKDKAPKYIKEYHQISDSIQFEQRKVRNQFYKIQLETDEITQEKETAIKQKWVITSIISSVLLIVILLFVIYRQRSNQKELQLVQLQQKGNEEIYQLMLNQQKKVEEARQIEKKRIALELHDGIMNRLASTRLNLFVLSKKNDAETIDKCISYIEDIHEIENEIRHVSHDLNQDIFTEKDSFKALLTQFVVEQNSHLKIKYELQLDTTINWDLIASQTKMHLYRVIQEATHNCNKHTTATTATICFTLDENQLCLSITDNGAGFDTEKTKDGIGLKNMQQRIQSLQGTLVIESKANLGTSIYVKIPM